MLAEGRPGRPAVPHGGDRWCENDGLRLARDDRQGDPGRNRDQRRRPSHCVDRAGFFTPASSTRCSCSCSSASPSRCRSFPFHTWLPDAHVEAPTPISMILAGVLLKMGGYGIIRIAYPICPWAASTLAWWLALFGIINIVYGAFAAMAQTDFKKLVAYSSVSHMGYVILGIAVWSATAPGRQYWAWGMNGAMFQMIAHGITLGRHVLPGRRHLRPGPPPQPGQLPRPVRADAAVRRHQRDHLLRRAWACRGCAASSASSWWCWRPGSYEQGLRHPGGPDCGARRRRTSCGRSSASTSAPTRPTRITRTSTCARLLCIVPLVVLAVVAGRDAGSCC